jgi:hypothetical protein
MEQAMAALRSAARFADFVAERSGDEDAIALHRQCTEAIGALKEEIERAADREREGKRYAQGHENS